MLLMPTNNTIESLTILLALDAHMPPPGDIKPTPDDFCVHHLTTDGAVPFLRWLRAPYTTRRNRV